MDEPTSVAGQQYGDLQRDCGHGDNLERYKHRRDRTCRRDDGQTIDSSSQALQTVKVPPATPS